MFGLVVSQLSYKGGVETFCLVISLGVVLRPDDVIHPKIAMHCRKELEHKLWAIFGKKLRQSTVICHPTLKKMQVCVVSLIFVVGIALVNIV